MLACSMQSTESKATPMKQADMCNNMYFPLCIFLYFKKDGKREME